MSERLGPVDIEFALKNINFKQEAGRIKSEISGISQTAQREVSQTNELLRTLGRGVAAYFSFQAIKGFSNELINVRGEFEQLGIAFETMLGSKAAADKVMAEVVAVASATPFSLTELGQGAKMLLAFKEPADQVADTLSRMGDLAAGASVPVGDLIRAYGKVSAKGKMQAEELNQFAERGVPIISELAKVVGRTDAEIYKMAEQGQIGFAELQQAIRNMTDEGGMFFNLSGKQAESLTGMISMLGDAWDKMLNNIGEGNQTVLKGTIQTLIDMVNNYETILDILKIIVVTYGTYKAALIAISITEKIRYQITLAQMASTKGLTTLEALHAVVLGKVKDAQMLLNKTILKNPYAAAAALIGGLVAALVILSRRASEASLAQQKLAEASTKAYDGVAEEQSRIKVLTDTLNNENASRAEKERALKKLNEISPEYLGHLNAENIATREGKDAIDAYLESLRRKIEVQELERELGESIRRQNAAGRGDVDITWLEKFRGALLLQTGLYKKVAKEVTDEISEAIALEEDLQDKISARIQELLTPKTAGGSVEKSIQTIKDLKAELAELQKQREERTDKADKAELDRLAKLIIAKQREIEQFKIEAEKPDTRTDLEIFKDDLKDKKDLYAQFEAYKRVVGEEEAQKMYADLLEQADTYISFLRRKLETLPDGEKKAILATEIVATEGKTPGADDSAEKALAELLERTKSYNMRRFELEAKYQKELTDLRRHGSDEQVAELTRQHNEELAALEQKHLQESESYRWVYDDINRFNRQALRDYIQRLRDEIAAKAWSDEAKLMLSERLAQAEQKIADTVPERLNDVANILREAASLAGELDEELARAISTAADLADAAANIATGIASSNPFQIAAGILQAATSLVKYFSSAEKMRRETEELTEAIGELNEQLDRQASLLERLSGDEKANAYIEMLSNLGEQADKTKEQLFSMVKAMAEGPANAQSGNNFLDWWNRITSPKYHQVNTEFQNILKELELSVTDIDSWTEQDWINIIGKASGETRKQLEALYDQWVELQDKQGEYYQQMAEYATGISFDDFTNEFLEALMSGERSAQDFADNVEDMLRKAIIQGFKTKYLMDALEPWYKQFAEFASDGLTTEEVAALRETLQNVFADASEAFTALGDLGIDMAGNGDTANSLAGSIKGITEDTASVLAGRLNAMHLAVNEHLRVAQRAVLHQAETALNTRELFAVKNLLTDIRQSLRGNDSNSINSKRAGGR